MSGKKLRILLAEGGSGETAGALRALFPAEQDTLELTIVSAVSILIPTLEIVNPEVILLDLALAHPNPLEAVRRVHRAAPAVPLIAIAELGERDLAAQSLDHGALDYLLKGCMDAPAFERVLRPASQQNIFDGLADLLRDSVTGLYIRDGFLSLGARAVDTAKRKLNTLILLCIRIENQTPARSECGPGAEEISLRDVAAVLTGSFRRTDIVARLGESEFAALAVNAAEPSGPVLCQRLQKRIAVLNHRPGPGHPLKIRMSVGFWSSTDTRSFTELLNSVEAGLRTDPAPVFSALSQGENP
jgi:two-component system cell cycle response regulator